MSGYSRENKRQNQALQSILDGNTPEKRIMVAMEDVNEKKERQKQMIKEFRDQKNPEFYQQFRPDGYSVDKEKWGMNITHIKKQADEALEFLQKMEDSLK